MEESPRVFHGKLMLFGEYAVMLYGKALTIPLYNYSAALKFPAIGGYNEQSLLNRQLSDYFLALVHERETTGNDFGIDLKAFETDLGKGMYLDSDIPQGYGVGSSGALVASVYQRFALSCELLKPNTGLHQLSLLQKSLASLERYFHGTSSGIDPLSCYMARPILINEQGHPDFVDFKHSNVPSKGGFFLFDTNLPRKTDEMVALFRHNYHRPAFKVMMETEFLPLVEGCINSLLTAEWASLMPLMKELSEIQYLHFGQMIPENFKHLWKQGLENEHYTLKLCGAGGGGFLMGFTTDYQQLDQYFNNIGLGMIQVDLPA